MNQAPIVIIDCAFSELMVEKEIKSLINQLAYCYNMNKKAKKPCKKYKKNQLIKLYFYNINLYLIEL